MEQVQGQSTHCLANVLLHVLVDDSVDAGLVSRASAAKGRPIASDMLQLERHVLEHVSEPRALAFAQTTDEAAGLAVGTAVFVEPRQGAEKSMDKPFAQTAGGPLLELPQIQQESYHGEVGVEARAEVNTRLENFHSSCTSLSTPSIAGVARRVLISKRDPGSRMCSFTPSSETGSPG